MPHWESEFQRLFAWVVQNKLSSKWYTFSGKKWEGETPSNERAPTLMLDCVECDILFICLFTCSLFVLDTVLGQDFVFLVHHGTFPSLPGTYI